MYSDLQRRHRHHRGCGAPLPDAQADDDHGTVAEVQEQEDWPHFGAAGQRHDTTAQEDQPCQTNHKGQDVPLPQAFIVNCDTVIFTFSVFKYYDAV